jgi:hypothetical protein
VLNGYRRVQASTGTYHVSSRLTAASTEPTANITGMQSTKSIIVQLTISTTTNNPEDNKPSTTTTAPPVDLSAGTTTHVNQIPSLLHPNISNPRNGAAWSNDDDLDLEMSN